MAQHISEEALRVHPAEPTGQRCPGCTAVGLPGRIPCAPRIEALRLLRLARPAE
jgi:hypothetical protein